jgi:hypothetical protein
LRHVVNAICLLLAFLFTSKELKRKANINAQDNEGLRLACLHGKYDNQLEVVEYLLTSPQLKKHAQITDNAFRDAAAFGKLEVVKYLLTSPDLKEHANIHADQDYAFYAACKYERFDALDFYCNDLKLEVTKDMIKQVDDNIVRGVDGEYEDYSYESAMKIRGIIELANKMNTDLSDKPETKRKMKI